MLGGLFCEKSPVKFPEGKVNLSFFSQNEWNASHLVGQARKLELGDAFGASLITTVRQKIFPKGRLT